MACRAEPGRFPLNITINQKILKYLLYIQSKLEESLVKQAFFMSFGLHCNGKNSFHSHLMNMLEYFKLPDFNPDLLDMAMVKLRICSCLACVYRVMDARGKFGEHERCVRVARGDSRVQL